MADPVTIGLGASAGGALIGAVGNLWSGQAQSNQYRYQAGIASMNAQIARQNAEYAYKEGEVEAQQQGLKTRSIIGTTRAQQGASNLDVNKGSAVDVRASEADIGVENTALVRYGAAKKAYASQVAAAQDDAQATMDLKAASNARIASYIGAGSSILGGASSVSSKWMQAKQAGALPFGSSSNSFDY